MKKKFILLIIMICLVINISGCNFLEYMVSDVEGWNFAACVDGFGTCWEFYFDNVDKFDSGFSTVAGDLTEGVK